MPEGRNKFDVILTCVNIDRFILETKKRREISGVAAIWNEKLPLQSDVFIIPSFSLNSRAIGYGLGWVGARLNLSRTLIREGQTKKKSFSADKEDLSRDQFQLKGSAVNN